MKLGVLFLVFASACFILAMRVSLQHLNFLASFSLINGIHYIRYIASSISQLIHRCACNLYVIMQRMYCYTLLLHIKITQLYHEMMSKYIVLAVYLIYGIIICNNVPSKRLNFQQIN